MVAIESVMLSCTIDAHEGCDGAATDIPGAFLQADMEGNVHMMLEGKMAELLARLDPKMYRKHIMIKKGKPIMYVQFKKGPLWNTTTGLTTILERPVEKSERMGVRNQPIRLVCRKQKQKKLKIYYLFGMRPGGRLGEETPCTRPRPGHWTLGGTTRDSGVRRSASLRRPTKRKRGGLMLRVSWV
jgi:hypothetical protein